MIMKYKDFKMLSKDDMRQIVGGSAPLIDCSASCPAGQTAQGCTGCHHCSDIVSGGVVTGIHTCPGEGESGCLDHYCSGPQ